MKAFIDTSALLKKYIEEKGSLELNEFLSKISEITVSPVYLIEAYSVFERRLKEKILGESQAFWLKDEVKKDYNFFNKVIFNENLMNKALYLTEKYHLKTLDSVQLASGCLADSEVFLTSDKRLFDIAKRELKFAKFV